MEYGIMTNIVMITQEMKYTDIHHFQIKEFEKEGVVNVVPIESKFNPADLITKTNQVNRKSLQRLGQTDWNDDNAPEECGSGGRRRQTLSRSQSGTYLDGFCSS